MATLWDTENEFQKYLLDYKILGGRYQVGSRQLAVRYPIVNCVLCSIITEHRLTTWLPSGIQYLYGLLRECQYPRLSPVKETLKIMYFHFFTGRETEGLRDKVASLELHS